MATKRERAQFDAIHELVDVAQELGTPVWLRGGWAVDFFLGYVTRAHGDVDWFALDVDGPRLRRALVERGLTDVTSAAAAEQQIDLVRGLVEHGISLVRIGTEGEPLVAGGPWQGEPWPPTMLDGPLGRIGEVGVRVIDPKAKIEIKVMTPTWNPALSRRQKDLDDIEKLRRGRQSGGAP